MFASFITPAASRSYRAVTLDKYVGSATYVQVMRSAEQFEAVSIYRIVDTARLDEFVGPKTRAVPLNSVHYTA